MIKLGPPPQRGESSKEERYQYWQQVMDCYESSDMTRLSFCKQQALNIDDFRRWRYRLSRAAVKTLASSAYNRTPPKVKPQPAHFVPVQITPPMTCSQYPNHSVDNVGTTTKIVVAPFIIELNHGIRIQVHPPFTSSSLKQLLKTVGEAPC